MLTGAKNQIKVIFLSIKYNIMRQMVNKVTFITNILFMILNNATFIIQWIILFNIKDEIGGYGLREIYLLWGLAASGFGIANIVFRRAFTISELIINGKLDTFLVQPKNVFLSVITSETSISAIGDLIYGYICLALYGITLKIFVLFTIFSITSAIILAAFSSIVGSTSFWITKSELLANSLFNVMVNFATYPGSIFKGTIRLILYTIIPVGIANYVPLDVIVNFNIWNFLYVILFTIGITILAFIVFYRGLKRYSSSNLMGSRI